MSYLLVPLGLFILIVALVDIFKTILYINGGGRLSSFTARKIWWVYFKMARGKGKAPILNFAGGTILMGLVAMWIFLIWVGYSLIYLSDPNFRKQHRRKCRYYWEYLLRRLYAHLFRKRRSKGR